MIKPAAVQKQDTITRAEFLPVQRLTALWALSEAALGGVLHALRLPFTGMFMGSVAVLLITMIALFSDKKGDILKATIIVLIVKGAVSPHTPVTAYGAVFLQGLIGEAVFRRFKSPSHAALLLGGSALFLAAVQKFLILTLVFGMTVWKSLDLFGNFVVHELGAAQLWLPISTILITVYIALHLLAGLLSGWYAPRMAAAIQREYETQNLLFPGINLFERVELPKKKHRRWLRRLSAYLVIGLALAIVVLSYIVPVFEENQGLSALVMVVRSLAVMGVWIYFAAPFFRKKLQAYLQDKESQYAGDVQSVLLMLPQLRAIAAGAYRYSSEFSGLKRWKRFIFVLLVQILTAPLPNKTTNEKK